MGSAIYTRRPDGTITANLTIENVGAELQAGATLIKTDGTPLEVREFMGGLLIGPYALPMNVVLFDTWYPQQQEVLSPHWQAGDIPKPPDEVLALETVDPEAGGGYSSLLVLGLLAAGAFALMRRRG